MATLSNLLDKMIEATNENTVGVGQLSEEIVDLQGDVTDLEYAVANQEETVTQNVLASLDFDVFGRVDSQKNIIIENTLSGGLYTFKYENEDGTYTDIGTLKIGAAYTNLYDKDKVLLNARFNSSRTAVAQNGCFATNVCELPDDYLTNDCYLYLKGINPTGGTASYNKLLLFNTEVAEALAIGSTATVALQFNLETNLGVKWETLDADSLYYRINLKQNATGSIQDLSINKAFAIAFSIGTTALTKDTLPDIIMTLNEEIV